MIPAVDTPDRTAGAIEESRHARRALDLCCGRLALLTLADAAAEGDGLVADADRVPWARLQGRIALAHRRAGLARRPGAARAQRPAGRRVGLLGDYYFGSLAARAGTPGGFRATSGVLIGAAQRAGSAPPGAVGRPASASTGACSAPAAGPLAYPADPVDETATVPYVGVGYSSLSATAAGASAPTSAWCR